VHADVGLLRAGFDRGERVRDREAEVVVAVDGDAHAAVVRGERAAHREHELRELVRLRVADGVRDVDDPRAGARRGLVDGDEEVDVRARRVLGRELDLVGVLHRARDGLLRALDARAAVDAELALEMDVARGDEDVDARAVGARERLRGRVDVTLGRARERGDGRATPDFARDRGDGRGFAGRRRGEARLDHVDAEVRERVREAELRRRRKARARRLFAVAEGRVEDLYFAHGGSSYFAAATASAARGASCMGTSFLGSQGIIRRSARPTSSIGWRCSFARVSYRRGAPLRYSAIHSFANVPSLISARILRIDAFTWSSTTRGPRV